MAKAGVLEAAPVFAALGDETRLRLITRLGRPAAFDYRAVGWSATSRQAVTKHLRVLETAGLVRSARAGREQHWELEAERLDEAKGWLETLSKRWDERRNGCERSWRRKDRDPDRQGGRLRRRAARRRLRPGASRGRSTRLPRGDQEPADFCWEVDVSVFCGLKTQAQRVANVLERLVHRFALGYALRQAHDLGEVAALLHFFEAVRDSVLDDQEALHSWDFSTRVNSGGVFARPLARSLGHDPLPRSRCSIAECLATR